MKTFILEQIQEKINNKVFSKLKAPYFDPFCQCLMQFSFYQKILLLHSFIWVSNTMQKFRKN